MKNYFNFLVSNVKSDFTSYNKLLFFLLLLSVLAGILRNNLPLFLLITFVFCPVIYLIYTYFLYKKQKK
ncbi:hypothetical protein BG262_10105 [Floricoccus penangensis]|uniref:Uncharacterized protein n=1 Tax=Floricoccus penangensis TaxID=1859475 RepID=A0A9Q5JH10_9LACT|nr:hypothetical protein BG262_10105 [Floricoccus penangensis]